MKKLLVLLAYLLAFLSMPHIALAASDIPEVYSFVSDSLRGMAAIAGLATTFFLVKGGYGFITSAGSPEALDHAKKTIRNAIIGFVLVLAAITISQVLKTSLTTPADPSFMDLPKIEPIKADTGTLGQIILDAIGGMLKNIVETAIKPVTEGILRFLQTTPQILTNSAIFNFWAFMLLITNALFALVIGLIGFQFMSASTFGFEELELKKILPRIGLGFLGANTSIFLIDWVVRLNDTLVGAVLNQFDGASSLLINLFPPAAAVAFLQIIMLFFLILAVILLVIYVNRLIIIALGAVLSPIFFLLWTFPKFADFTEISAKAYLLTIFSTFVHAVILQLGASFLILGDDPFVSYLVAIGLLLVMIKTLPTMIQMTFYNSGKALIKNTGGQLMNVLQNLTSKDTQGSTRKSAAVVARKVAK